MFTFSNPKAFSMPFSVHATLVIRGGTGVYIDLYTELADSLLLLSPSLDFSQTFPNQHRIQRDPILVLVQDDCVGSLELNSSKVKEGFNYLHIDLKLSN